MPTKQRMLRELAAILQHVKIMRIESRKCLRGLCVLTVSASSLVAICTSHAFAQDVFTVGQSFTNETRKLERCLGPTQFGIIAHNAPGRYKEWLTPDMRSYRAYVREMAALGNPLDSLFLYTCYGAARSPNGTAIQYAADRLRLPVYGFRTAVGELQTMNGRRLGPREVLWTMENTASILWERDTGLGERVMHIAPPSERPFLWRAVPGGRALQGVTVPFEALPRAKSIYIQHNSGLTCWHQPSPRSSDPLARYTGSRTLIGPEGFVDEAFDPGAVTLATAGGLPDSGCLSPLRGADSVDVAQGVAGAFFLTADYAGSRLAGLGLDCDNEGMAGLGFAIQGVAAHCTGNGAGGLPSLDDMMASVSVRDTQADAARAVLTRQSGADVCGVIGMKTEAELTARWGYHPGWCPVSCGPACPNSYRPNWLQSTLSLDWLLGSPAVAGGPFDRRIGDGQ